MPDTPNPPEILDVTPSPTAPAWRLWAVGALVLLALLLVFALYSNPHFMVMMADQAWSCF